MIFYINFTTAARVLLLLLLILVSVNSINGANYFMKHPLFENEIKDITKTLSDKEIEQALSDLSLPDLKALSKLIDSSNAADYEETDDNFLDSNEHMQTFYDIPDKNAIETNDDDDSEAESDGYREPRSVLQFQIPRDSLITQYSMENARSKREDSQNSQGNTVDAEYLKLLENSFPHGAEQNDHEDSETKKEHIRVKRKPMLLDKQESNKLK